MNFWKYSIFLDIETETIEMIDEALLLQTQEIDGAVTTVLMIADIDIATIDVTGIDEIVTTEETEIPSADVSMSRRRQNSKVYLEQGFVINLVENSLKCFYYT